MVTVIKTDPLGPWFSEWHIDHLSEPIYEFEKRRYHLNRNAAWRRLWPKTTRLPASLQSHAIGHTWSRATEPGRRSRLADFLIDLMDFLIDKDRGSTLPCNCHMQSMLHQVFS